MQKSQKTNKPAKAQKSEPIVVAQIMGKWVGGGVESVIMNYYRHIDRSKIQFDFICDEDSTNIPYEEIEKLGGKVILCPPYQKLPKYLKFLKNLFREKQYRIVHSNINALSIFPLYAAKKAGVPVRIAHSHSTSNPREWKKNLMKNALRPFSKVWATDYFACSELAGRYLFGDKTFDNDEVKIIRNAIDVEKFKFDPETRKKLRKEIGIADDCFVIGHIGRFVEQKNHRFLIDVFAEVKKEKKNAKLVLVGQGPLREEMEQKVKDLGLEKDIFFLGQRSDTNKLYSVFDVFCLPSLYEGLPVVGVEAQANGVPCVFSDRITKEVIIARNVEMVELDVSKIVSAIGLIKKRIDPKDSFDIKDTAQELMREYLIVKNYKFSIIIPCYNSSKYINRCLDSILKQSYDNYEIIVVDDGSTDDTVAKVNQINTQKIKVIGQKNMGAAVARNRGISYASGDYIIFVDSDDYIGDVDYLKKINKAIVTTRKKIIIHDMSKNVPDNKRMYGNYLRTKSIRRLISTNKYKASPTNKIIKLDLIRENNIKFPEGRFAEDIEWCSELLRFPEEMYWLEYAPYIYVQRNDSVSKDITERYIYDTYYQVASYERESSIVKNYLAYEYAVLLGLISTKNLKNKVRPELKQQIYAESKILKYSLNRKVKAVRFLVKLLGVRSASEILGMFIDSKGLI